MKATLSADIVKSTTLSGVEMVEMAQYLQEYLQMARMLDSYCWGRVVRGDGIECAFDRVTYLLRLVLLLKFHLKAFRVEDRKLARHTGLDVRIAVALGELRTNDQDRGIIDGEAIYDSGRALADMSRSSCRDLIVVKSRIPEMTSTLNAIFALVDYIASQATSKQAEVLVLKLLRIADGEIAEQLHVSKPNVSVHLRRSGWAALEKALAFFEETF